MTAVPQEAIPVAEPAAAPFEQAADLLEQAIRAGCRDPNAFYLLALAYKRLGKTKEAREAFRRIATPDANVCLQLGLLALEEGQLVQAEQEFGRALELDASLYAACYDLVLTRLSLGDIDAALVILPKAIELAAEPAELRLLELLQVLLHTSQPPNGEAGADPALRAMSDDNERGLLRLIRGIGHLETTCRLAEALAAARPESAAVQSALVETTLVHGKHLLDRGQWLAAKRRLASVQQAKASLEGAARSVQAAYRNLLGCCALLCQDFQEAVEHFAEALRLAGNDARIQQNMALGYELLGDLARAEPHWNQYFDLLDDRVPAAPGTDYVEKLAFESLNRLATRYSEREKWSNALVYLERAQKLKPENTELLERLLQLHTQARRPDAARRVLRQLKQLRPDEPQLELYELDIGEPRDVEDIERLLGGVSEVRERHSGDVRVEERAATMIGNAVPYLHRFCEAASGQLSKMIDRVHHTPNDEINWRTVREIALDLRREFQQLRRTANKCINLVTGADQRRTLRDLVEHLERKIDQCRRWEED